MNLKNSLLVTFGFTPTDEEFLKIRIAQAEAVQLAYTDALLNRRILLESIIEEVKDELFTHYLSINKVETNVFLRKLYVITKNIVLKKLIKLECEDLALTPILAEQIYNSISDRTLYKGDSYNIMEFVAWSKPECPID